MNSELCQVPSASNQQHGFFDASFVLTFFFIISCLQYVVDFLFLSRKSIYFSCFPVRNSASEFSMYHACTSFIPPPNPPASLELSRSTVVLLLPNPFSLCHRLRLISINFDACQWPSKQRRSIPPRERTSQRSEYFHLICSSSIATSYPPQQIHPTASCGLIWIFL